MEWKLFKQDPKRKKWSIRGTRFDGVDVKIPAHRDIKIAEPMRVNIEKLNRAAAFGEAPPAELRQWIDNLSQADAERLVVLKFLDRRRLDQRLPIGSLIDEFQKHLEAECDAGSTHPIAAANKIRRLIEAMNIRTFKDLTNDGVKNAVKSMKALGHRRRGKEISKKTEREYIFAIKRFCEWMVDEERVVANPLRKLKAPAAREHTVVNRRPMSVSDFNKLMVYLRNAPDRYPHQLSDWTPQDRAMIYWAAVMTGFRMNELRSLTRAHFNFEASPARVTVDGWVAKNGQKATIPVGDDFAAAMHDYVAHFLPHAPLFRIPSRHSMLAAFYRDLDNAGVERRFENGESVDFHTLRSTAICWWLTENELNLLDTQFRARLKTLDLVQKYVERYMPDFKALVEKTPQIADPRLPHKKAS